MVENWCLKCNESTVMIDIVEGVAKNGRGTLRGLCAECGFQDVQVRTPGGLASHRVGGAYDKVAGGLETARSDAGSTFPPEPASFHQGDCR